MTLVLATLAVLSLALLLWQWLEATLFPLHRREPDTGFAPALTLLKPLKGADAETGTCLRSWLAQDYAGPVQFLFAVATENDPAVAVVRRLQAEFPKADAQLVVCPERLGLNSKVSKLAQLEPHVKHAFLVVSDADVRVPPDFLRQAVQPLRDPAVGLVNPFYQLATPATPAMHWEALATNADFWSSVLQARRFGPMHFALGAAMLVRREALAGIGGFKTLLNHLADDYELGKRVTAGGARVAISPTVVECREAARGWGAIWRHQLRWSRTIRHCQPAPYAASILSNPTLWPLLWLAGAQSSLALDGFGVCLAARLAMAAHCQWRLTRSWRQLPWLWLAPVKDLLGATLWALAFLGHTVEWRGERFRVRRGGELQRRV